MTIEAYVKAKQVALGCSIEHRKKVYLDLNFWIVARDAALIQDNDGPARELLDLLREGVEQGRLICPIGDSVFMELMKQPLSEDRRLGTARLVDELSLGVAMMPSDRRIATEISILIHAILGRGGTLHSMQELVWTKVCHVVGESYPLVENLDPATLLQLQKGFVDRLWETPIVRMFEMIGDAWDASRDYVDLSADTNLERDKHAGEITSYARAYEIEIAGAIDGAGDLIADVLCGLGAAEGHTAPPPGSEAWERTENFGKNVLLHAFTKLKAARIVRTLHIEAALHAAMRVDKSRRFKPNDFYDLRHASAALAYCDVFFTERPLHDLVRRKQLDLLAINGCQVRSDLTEAMDLLRKVVKDAAPEG